VAVFRLVAQVLRLLHLHSHLFTSMAGNESLSPTRSLKPLPAVRT